jgi:hypothetical protein
VLGVHSEAVVYARKASVGLDVDTSVGLIGASVFDWEQTVAIPSLPSAQIPATVGRTGWRSAIAGHSRIGVGRIIACGGAALSLSVPDAWKKVDPRIFQEMSVIKLDPSVTAAQGPTVQHNAPAFNARPMRFVTTSSLGFGLEIEESDRGRVPTAIHAGFRQKDKFVVPVRLETQGTEARTLTTIRTPSVLALLDGVVVESADRDMEDNRQSLRKRYRKTKIQFFAAGRSATTVCQRADVRRAILYDLVNYPRSTSKDSAAEDPTEDTRTRRLLSADASGPQAPTQLDGSTRSDTPEVPSCADRVY